MTNETLKRDAEAAPLLEARRVGVRVRATGEPLVTDVSLTLRRGRCLGIVGDSGSGKTLLCRSLLGLERPDAGQILLEGMPIRRWRARHPGGMSVVFQDYVSSVPPRASVAAIIAEGFPPGAPRPDSAAIHALMDRVALPRFLSCRLPHELSGGQLQRVCIARAIAARPSLLVLDEPVSSLDIAVQARILELLHELAKEMTCLFITHDIQAAVHLCEQLVFLHQGQCIASLPRKELFRTDNPHVRDLLACTLVFETATNPAGYRNESF